MKEKEITLDIDGKDYKVVISSFTADQAEISVNGKKYLVGLKDLGIEQVSDIKPQPLPKEPGAEFHRPAAPVTDSGKRKPVPIHRPKTIDNKNTILAPLPGLITKILVREGDSIKVGQPVLIIEAMKMENEINASNPGMIINICFREGDSVNQGDVLFHLKPMEA